MRTHQSPIFFDRYVKALRHLEPAGRPLSEVAQLLGFASLSAFSRLFSGQFGCSVMVWRSTQANTNTAGGIVKTSASLP